MELALDYVGPRTWLPDETIFSLASRYHRLSGHARSADTSRLMFGHPQRGAIHDFTPGIDAFCRRTSGLFGDPEAVVWQRTLLPLYLALQSTELIDHAVITLRGDTLGSLKYQLGLLTSRFGARHPLKSCARCSEQDRDCFGTAYWHRRHQWPGVWYCHAHGDPLRPSGAKRANLERFQFHLPDEVAWCAWPPAPAGQAGANDLPGLGYALAEIAYAMASVSPDDRLDGRRLKQAYVEALIARGLASKSGRLRLQAFGTELYRFVAPLRTLPDLAALPATAAQAESQFARLVRRDVVRTHPVRHMVMMLWLFGNWSAVVAAYARAEPPGPNRASPCVVADDQRSDETDQRFEVLRRLVVSEGQSVTQAAQAVPMSLQTALEGLASRGVSIKRRPKMLDSSRRQRIIADLEDGQSNRCIADSEGVSLPTVGRVLRSEPGLQARCLLARRRRARGAQRDVWQGLLDAGFVPRTARLAEPAVYAWLYRNDRTWLLSQNREHALPPQGNHVHVDWDARDRHFAEQVDKAALRLAEQNPDSRITLGGLLQNVTGLAEKQRKFDRLPLTTRAIERALGRDSVRPSPDLLADGRPDGND